MTSQDLALCKQSIMQHEGFSPEPVPDSNGTTVIGYGWNPMRDPMLEVDAKYLLDQQLLRNQAALTAAWPTYAVCDGPRQRCLLEMSYQLGIYGLMLFSKMLHAIALKDYAAAAAEIRSAKLMKQTPSRAQFYIELLLED